MQKELEKEYYVSAADCNPEGELSLVSLIDRIIEIATCHANSIHIGNPDMEHINGGWVLGRLTVEVSRYPEVNSSYRISTWIEDFNRLFSTRCFEITDLDGRRLGVARSVWMVINLSTHENMGLSHFSFDRSLISHKDCGLEKQLPHKFQGGIPVNSYKFRYSDLDYYRHVNTLRWIELLLNQYSLEEFDRNFISRFEISFAKEGHYGSDIDIYCVEKEKGDKTWTMLSGGNLLIYSRIKLRTRCACPPE